MANKTFSLASWNVEHFRDDPDRMKNILQFLKTQNPDVFGLYEVEGKEVFSTLTKAFPNYTFHVTEGPQVQEILIGVRNKFTAFFTQRIEFKSGLAALRPGALLSLRVNGSVYAILFLHTKSGSNPMGLGVRDDMFERALKLKKKLDKAAGGTGQAKFLFLGDLNTMGMKYPFERHIDGATEVKKLARVVQAKSVMMRHLTKNRPHTWSNGNGSKYPPADIDHVVASHHLKFKQWKDKDIDVRGWPAITDPKKRDQWIKTYSDHGLLYLEVLN